MKAIFFDLDGTLLPLDEKLFVDIYFAELSKVFSEYNIDSKKLVERELMKRPFGISLIVI